MTKTIFGKKLLLIATITVLVTGLTLAATLDDAEAKGNTIVITGTPGDDQIKISDHGNNIRTCCDVFTPSGVTVTGPVTGPVLSCCGEEVWTINPGVGNGVDTKYEFNGNAGTDRLDFLDGPAPDDDKVEIENVDIVRIIDGVGDDKYEIKDSSGVSVEYFDGPGDDKLEVKG